MGDRRGGRPKGKANPGRVAAVRTLLAVEEGANAEDALARYTPTDPADRALAWAVVLGVQRNRAALDTAVVAGAKRAVWTLDPPVLAVLRAGLYERTFMRTPAHAVVDQAVEVARAAGVGHASGFVNALMRRAEVPREGDAALGFPEWLLLRWRARWGAARADGFMRACAEPAPIHLVAKEDPAGVAARFQHAGIVLSPVGEGVFRLPPRAGRVDELPGFAEGSWWVMDPAAVAVADLVPPGCRVLDACAAPGGKSLRMAARGCEVTAFDVDDARIARVVQNAGRVGLPVRVHRHDWLAGGPDARWPSVLVDAPCTALGLVRRHPEIRWRRTEADLHAAAMRQRTILANAARCVEPGGCLVYAVCSTEPEEGEERAAEIGWPIEATFDTRASLDGADGFWACRLRAPA